MENSLQALTSTAEWKAARDHSEETPVLIYKHSSACPVSAKARGEVEELVETDDLPVYEVVVQTHREISDTIEADLDLRHETPQVILLRNGRVAFDASHFDVTADAIRSELQESSSSSS
jgi:bacillithiol system protein YtxJ